MHKFVGCCAVLLAAPAHSDVVSVTLDLREWVVDFLRPTIDKPIVERQMPYFIPTENKMAALLANGSYPGPAIEAFENDTIEVTVLNNLLAENVAIHWHGVFQLGTPAMDGVHGVTQGPILPQGGSMTYRFLAFPSGTHFWHAHYQAQQADRGLKGPIVIRKREDPYKHLYDEERVISLSDAWPEPAVCLRAEGAAAGNPVCAEIDRATFNGQYGNGTKEYPWPMIDVEQGKCYRMRFVGMMGQAQNFQVSMAGHSMKIIAYDSTEIEPLEVSKFNLHAGERVDAIVCADQPVGHYRITAEYDLACPLMPGAMGPVNPNWWRMAQVDECAFYAFFRYKGSRRVPRKAPKKNRHGAQGKPPQGTGGGKKPRALDLPELDLNTHSAWNMLVPREPRPEPEEPDVRYVLQMGVKDPKYMEASQAYGLSYPMYLSPEDDLRPWSHPKTPLLHTLGECGTNNAPVIEVPEGASTIELVLNNVAPTAHVLHMHGMKFKVLNTGNISETWCSTAKFACFGTPWRLGEMHCPGDLRHGDPDDKGMLFGTHWGCAYNEEKDKGIQYDLDKLMEKDMISIWRRSWAVIRVPNVNPGFWTFHCHMEQHIPTGQMMVLGLKKSEIPAIPDDVPREGPCPVFSDHVEMTV